MACLLAWIPVSSEHPTPANNYTNIYPISQLWKIPIGHCPGLPERHAGLSAVNQNAIIHSHLEAETALPAGTKAAMTEEEERELRAQLSRLQQEHRDLDAAIAALQDSPGADIIQVQRLKKRKLLLRDRITFIEDQLTPDIIA